MHYLVEDPTYVLIGLGTLVVVCLIALKVTQQGKFLIWAGGLAILAAGVFGFERYWVTDAERVEAVVYDLAAAVRASDVERIQSHLDDRVTFGMGEVAIDGSMPLRLVFPLLRRTHFESVWVTQLTTSAMPQAKRGTAEFKVSADGTLDEAGSQMPVRLVASEWSLGFVEKSPGVWKVTRVTAIRLPREAAKALFGR